MVKMKGKLHFDYDKKGDVLYSFIDKPRPAKTVQMENGVNLRIDPTNQMIVGFTIQDFKKRHNITVPYFSDCHLPAV